MTDQYRFFMAKPKKSFYWTTFFDVFHVEFWIVVILVSCVMAFFLYFGNNIQNVSVKLNILNSS
jgi:hypothetical protein